MTTYDRLTANSPPEQPHEIGHEDGETCGRYPEPDEDEPRGYKPRPCGGVMTYNEQWDELQCDTCNEFGH